jgi:hypothetical protein
MSACKRSGLRSPISCEPPTAQDIQIQHSGLLVYRLVQSESPVGVPISMDAVKGGARHNFKGT